MTSFSFNKPAGACPTCTGLGVTVDLLMERIFDPSRGVARWGRAGLGSVQRRAAFRSPCSAPGSITGFDFDLHQPIGELGELQRDFLYYGVNGELVQAPFSQKATRPLRWSKAILRV